MALRLAASMIAILCAPSAFAQQIVVQPYLQSATPDSVWVMWETDAADDARVDWGPTSGLGEIAMGTTQEGQDGSVIHEVQLDGLSPDTRYYYQVFTGDAQSEVHHFITPPDPASETDFRIVAMSDMQRDGGNPDKWYEVVHDGVLAFTAAEFGDDVAEELAMVLLPGDLVDNGWSYEQWAEEFFEPCADLLAAVPAYPAIGNHEANTPYYFRYFHLPDNGMGEIYTEHWWSVHHSNVRIIGLDSNAAFRIEEQLTWLEEQLDDACLDPTVDFVFAQLHHPYQSELWPAGDTDYTGEVVALLETFTTDCSKPSIHFFGHTHGYSRGQSRDHRHLWVNVASAGGNIDYWDEYDQTDHEQFTVSQDEWGFVMIEVEAGADPRFRLRRVSRGNEDLARDNEVRDEVVVRLHADPPTTPTGLWPADEAVAPDCATLWACPFHDPDDELHGASWWQVSADCADFSSPVLERWVQHENQYGGQDTLAGVDLTEQEIADLTPDGAWCWRVRHRDRGLRWSDWSEPLAFTTGPSSLETLVLLDPGAEDGIEGWTVTAGHLESLTSGECDGTEPHTGDRYFAVGALCESTAYGEAYQRVDVGDHAAAIDGGATLALFEGWLSDWGGDDRPEIELVFRDAADAELGRSERLGSTATTWTLVQGETPVPIGTRAVELVLMGTRNAGVDNDSYIDDLRLRLALDGSPECDEAPADMDPEALCPEPPAADDDDSTAADDDDDDSATGSGDDGCGNCSQAPASTGGALLLIGLAAALVRTRRATTHFS